MGSLALLNALPDPQAQIRSLQQQLHERSQELAEAEAHVAALKVQLARESAKLKAVERGAQQLRTILTPLHRALGAVFGEVESMGIADEPSPEAAARRPMGAWDSWKKKMPGVPAQVIDILMVHGQLNHEQIRIHVGTNRKQTIYDAISKLNKASLLNKNGDRFSLKEL